MNKRIMIFLSMMFVVLGGMCTYADEYHYTYYDYETGEETKITLTDEDILLKIGSLNKQTSVEDDLNEMSSEENEEANTFKEMSSGTYISTLDIMNGKPLVKVPSLVAHYKKIVCIRSYIGVDEYCGTGFMVAPNIMLTAGHCMYASKINQNVDEMRIYYLQNDDVISSSFTRPAGWIVPDEYKAGNDDYDWCIVFLQQPIGNTIGYFDYAVTPNSVSSVFVSGYPSVNDVYQYSSNGSLSYFNEYEFYHTCSTLDGHSGAPIFGGTGIVYGIHTAGSDLDNPIHNFGNRITQSLFNMIEYYK